jgi:hypothetical protein
MRNGPGRGWFPVVRGCPLDTAQDCCEWHACGTVAEDDAVYQVKRNLPVEPLSTYLAAMHHHPHWELLADVSDRRLSGPRPDDSARRVATALNLPLVLSRHLGGISNSRLDEGRHDVGGNFHFAESVTLANR